MSLGKWLQKRSWVFGGAALVILVLTIVILRSNWVFTGDREIAFSDFVRAVEAGKVQQVAVSDQALTVTMQGGERVRTIPPVGYVSGNPAFVTDLVRRQVRAPAPVHPLVDVGHHPIAGHRVGEGSRGEAGAAQLDELKQFDARPTYNWRHLEVGVIRPAFTLEKAVY